MAQVTVRRDIPYGAGSGEEDLLLDLYLPPDVQEPGRRPAVIFIHGGSARARPVRAKEHGVFQCWGRLAAAIGLIGVTFNHRRSGEDALGHAEAAEDVDRLLANVRANSTGYCIDADRLALFAFSSAPPVGLRSALRDRPPYVRCIVVYAGIMDTWPYRDEMTLTDAELGAYSPTALVSRVGEDAGNRTVPPMLLARGGRDDVRHLNETIDRFVQIALAANVPLTLMNHPRGHHGFCTVDDDERSREIIRDTLTFLRTHLAEQRD